MRMTFNKDWNREFLKASWDVKKLCVAGRWREAVLLHHAQKSGMEAGYAMDSYLNQQNGVRRVNTSLVAKALSAMQQLDRVSRLMYRANLLEYQGLCAILAANDQNRKELNKTVNPEILDLLKV